MVRLAQERLRVRLGSSHAAETNALLGHAHVTTDKSVTPLRVGLTRMSQERHAAPYSVAW